MRVYVCNQICTCVRLHAMAHRILRYARHTIRAHVSRAFLMHDFDLCLKGQSPPQTQSPTRRTSSAKRTRHKTRSTRQTLMSSASWVAPHQRHNWESCLNHKSVSCPVQIKFLDLRRRGFKTQPQKTFQTFKNIKNLL